MRSRFSAFAVGDAGYLLRTWHPRTRPEELRIDPEVVWTSLQIVEATEDEVEFIARNRGPGGRASSANAPGSPGEQAGGGISTVNRSVAEPPLT